MFTKPERAGCRRPVQGHQCVLGAPALSSEADFYLVVPIGLSSIVVTVFAAVWIGSSLANPRGGKYSVPQAGSLQLLVYAIVVAILNIPMTVIINRYAMAVDII